MSTALVLFLAAWVALVAVAFMAACVQAVVHFLPAPAPAWDAPLAPTLAQERRA